ncbi:hypothetical protein [Emticicia sp. BO119]|uniref:hypothetical protein n=1 Tax=Emticicia sp. BO119 TaxID=2757768 RepID=UPI0015EFE068|nr:hypothetical protein [Emticicia sp. BO119]MBA4852394.1 hypothetical protein [Emticicia sp. BO119]
MSEKELKKIYDSKKEKLVKGEIIEGFKVIQFSDFKRWFNKEIFEKGCNYCRTTNEESQKLTKLRPYATRGGKRGNRLELGRKDTNLPFDNLNNLVWCCYWCNNAKTNFFSEEEFIPVGRAIGESLREIMKKEL